MPLAQLAARGCPSILSTGGRKAASSGRMAKTRASYVCQNCGAVTQRWQGRCDSCGEWNSIIEEAAALGVGGAAMRRGAAGRAFPLEDLAGDTRPEPRVATGIAELDRVAGGGFVPGSATLIGGEPGIGKSTLLIQASAAVARAGGRVVYVSGEESTAQVRLRASRLKLAQAPVQLAAQTLVEDIVATLSSGDAPRFVVVDSIQTMWSGAIESAPGTVSQVRGSAQALIRFAKASGAALLLVGHVTKDGQIAGPRVVEHMVDAVFAFDGDGAHAFRLLRAAASGRNPGPGRADHAWHAAAGGRRLGAKPPGDGARGARIARGTKTWPVRRLPQRRRRLAGRRARGRAGRRRGARLFVHRRGAAARRGLFRRNRALRLGAGGGAYRAAAERSRKARIHRGFFSALVEGRGGERADYAHAHRIGRRPRRQGGGGRGRGEAAPGASSTGAGGVTSRKALAIRRPPAALGDALTGDKDRFKCPPISISPFSRSCSSRRFCRCCAVLAGKCSPSPHGRRRPQPPIISTRRSCLTLRLIFTRSSSPRWRPPRSCFSPR